MKSTFIGRKHELNELNLLLNKKSASLVIIRGRRRIGKSYLAKHFGKKNNLISFAGLAPTSETTAHSQRQEFATQLTTELKAPLLAADDWTNLFQQLITSTTKGQFIILFDEISWMGEKDPLFLSKLKNAWEKLKDNSKIILILCGSVSSWIEENILSSTGFMGRISLDLILKELSLSECNTMLNNIGCKFNQHEKFKILSVTGGVPRYLEEIQPSLSADENIKRLCFSQSGILYREFEDIFNDMFTKKSIFYRKIVELLVHGPLTFKQVCDNLKVENSGFWSQYLEELVAAGFLKRDYTWSLKSHKQSTLSKFRLSDNYLRFYLKYIEPNKPQIQSNLFKNKVINSLPGWDSIMSLQFENLVLNNCSLIWDALNLNPNDIVTHGPYFQRKTSKNTGCQIDYLIATRFNNLILCEIKFSKNKISHKMINEMEQKNKALSLPTNHTYWPILIHVNGVSDALLDEEYFMKVIDFSDFLS